MIEEVVIAGSLKQYLEYIRDTGKDPEKTKFVFSEDQVRGVRDVIVTRHGTWWNNPICNSPIYLELIENRRQVT